MIKSNFFAIHEPILSLTTGFLSFFAGKEKKISQKSFGLRFGLWDVGCGLRRRAVSFYLKKRRKKSPKHENNAEKLLFLFFCFFLFHGNNKELFSSRKDTILLRSRRDPMFLCSMFYVLFYYAPMFLCSGSSVIAVISYGFSSFFSFNSKAK